MAQVLRYLSEARAVPDPDLLVGLDAPDDAAVYRLSDERAVAVTVDFFAPLVDDPYSYGAIAAANAMSDVYAMGGEVVLALNVAAFPEDMPGETIAEILRGGSDKVREAGGVIAGGHTVIDAEPKYGLCVLGLVRPDEVITKAGALPGDLLYLTKPLGTGIITTAAMRDEASPEHLQAAIETMTRLNRHTMHLAKESGVHAMTDITGYGILGHGYEVSAASRVAIRLDASRMPLLDGSLEYARRGIVTGGAGRNREYLEGKVRFARRLPEEREHLLFDPQTSGGLLIVVPPENGADLEARFRAARLPVRRIGEVAAGEGVEISG